MAVLKEHNNAKLFTLAIVSKTHTLDVVKRVKVVVDRKMLHLLDGMVLNVADALFEEMLDLQEQDALAWHFNIMRGLKSANVSMSDEFSTFMNLSWVHLINRRDRQTLPNVTADLMPLLKSYSDRNANHYKILLEEVRLRFCRLIKQDVQYHPFLPANFYLCFWHATEKLDLTHQERSLLLPLFNRFVMDRFGQVLAAANQTLAELHVHVGKPGAYSVGPTSNQ